MKILISLLLLLVPIVVIAEKSQGMGEQDMQMMMQQMQKMQSCMKDIDQTEMQALEKQSNQFQAEIKNLCSNGKQAEAQTKAISFAKQMLRNKSVKIMMKCTEKMRGMMSKMPFPDFGKDYSNENVCDSMK
jgi:hypothetical protein